MCAKDAVNMYYCVACVCWFKKQNAFLSLPVLEVFESHSSRQQRLQGQGHGYVLLTLAYRSST